MIHSHLWTFWEAFVKIDVSLSNEGVVTGDLMIFWIEGTLPRAF